MPTSLPPHELLSAVPQASCTSTTPRGQFSSLYEVKSHHRFFSRHPSSSTGQLKSFPACTYVQRVCLEPTTVISRLPWLSDNSPLCKSTLQPGVSDAARQLPVGFVFHAMPAGESPSLGLIEGHKTEGKRVGFFFFLMFGREQIEKQRKDLKFRVPGSIFGKKRNNKVLTRGGLTT